MSTIRTFVNDDSVEAFLNAVPDETKKADSFTLLEMFSRITGEPAKMWGTSMVGFGTYHYQSERSRQEGDWLMTGFSPRKQSLTLYITPGFADYQDILARLGKHKTTVGCLYINTLADIDMGVLEQLIARSYADMKKKYS